MRTALIIVHLGSLDSYAEFVGARTAAQLADRITDAVQAHRGPVYVIDQGWDGPLRNRVVEAISDTPAQWILFDEDWQKWERFLPTLKRRLAHDRVDRAVIGGIWYDPEHKSGCATEVYLYLRRSMPTKVDERLVGCEIDT